MNNSLHLYCGECRCLVGCWSAKWCGLQHWLWLSCVTVNVWGMIHTVVTLMLKQRYFKDFYELPEYRYTRLSL